MARCGSFPDKELCEIGTALCSLENTCNIIINDKKAYTACFHLANTCTSILSIGKFSNFRECLC